VTALLSQFGVVDEVTYGTAVAVTRFFETNGVPTIRPEMERAEADTLRAGSRVQSSLSFAPYSTGGVGTVNMPVPTKGFGWWLKHMLGTVASGSVVDSNYTHTGTLGSLLGDFFTAQVGRPFAGSSAAAQPFTGEGGKITSWELSCDVDGLLTFTAELDFEDVSVATSGAYALQTASYPSGALVFSFTGAALTIGGSSFEVKNLTIGCDNGLDVDRRFLRGSGLKKEPLESAKREITFDCEAEFGSLTEYNRYVNTAAASTMAALVATFTGPVAHAGATLPTLVVTIPAARFDNVDLSEGDNGATIMQSISGVARDNLSASPITIAYTTTDATP